jgi:LAO/AO transport system kinase
LDPINPNIRGRKKRQVKSISELEKGILAGDRASLSQALTLAESRLAAHRAEAEKLVQNCLPKSGQAIRIGITGVPGVGKSTFIEAFGEYLIKEGKKIAVLAIDPSSSKTRGSILGDKTRMENLSQNQNAFIRPSPAAGSLGGVARKTREAIILCEAAGYDVILVETVGVGQSETAVKNMVDFFMLLMLPGAGDELQGIKRGIMEMADLLLINKADDPKDPKVRLAMGEYKRALHLFPPNQNEWIPVVDSCSALKEVGIKKAWECILQFERQQKIKGYFNQNRSDQALSWFDQQIGDHLLEYLESLPQFKKYYDSYLAEIKAQNLDPGLAARKLLDVCLGDEK